jgi:hypothetical protein
MYSICLPRVSSHYDEVDVRNALNKGLGGEFVDKIDVRFIKDSRGMNFQVMFVHFLEKEGNEDTVEFFQRLEQKGELMFYTGAINRKTGERFFWKVRKITTKTRVEHAPGLMSEEDQEQLTKKAAEAASKLPKVVKEEGEVDEADEDEAEKDEAEKEAGESGESV